MWTYFLQSMHQNCHSCTEQMPYLQKEDYCQRPHQGLPSSNKSILRYSFSSLPVSVQVLLGIVTCLFLASCNTHNTQTQACGYVRANILFLGDLCTWLLAHVPKKNPGHGLIIFFNKKILIVPNGVHVCQGLDMII